jgi:hypothetical protein
MGGEEVEFLFVKAFEQGFAYGAEGFFRCAVTVGVLVFSAGRGFANWPKWRSPENRGSVGTGTYPVRWSGTESLRWKVDLPSMIADSEADTPRW